MKPINEIAMEYGLFPYRIKQFTDRVFKVNDGRQEFAVKRSSITESNLPVWENVYRQAAKHNLSNIAPVCLTENGNLYVKSSGDYYYLTPWFSGNDAEPEAKISAAMESLGKVHAVTVHQQPLQFHKVKRKFQDYQRACDKLMEKLLNHITSFERKRYMSPFELLTCTKSPFLNRAIRAIGDHTDDLLDNLEDDPVWKYCLCHGKPKMDHVLADKHTYLINWELARYDNPVSDLVYFFKELIRNRNISFKTIEKPLTAYIRYNKLSDREIHLLTIHLLNPFPFMSLVEKYAENRSFDTMLNQTTELNKASLTLQFGIDFAEYANSELIGTSLMESDD